MSKFNKLAGDYLFSILIIGKCHGIWCKFIFNELCTIKLLLHTTLQYTNFCINPPPSLPLPNNHEEDKVIWQVTAMNLLCTTHFIEMIHSWLKTKKNSKTSPFYKTFLIRAISKLHSFNVHPYKKPCFKSANGTQLLARFQRIMNHFWKRQFQQIILSRLAACHP